MNILPKKRWHVRTRENIAKVRKDELQAAEEAAEKKHRVLQAEQEARSALLRHRAREKYNIKDEEEKEYSANTTDPKHVNFFEDLEEGKIVTTRTNAEAEEEEKEKKEKYEKQIGYLTYLGQNTVEATGNVPWYDKTPEYVKLLQSDSKLEVGYKRKLAEDPLTTIRKYAPSESVTKKKESSIPPSSKPSNYVPIQLNKKRKHKKKRKKAKSKSHKKSRSSSSDCSDSSNTSESDDGIKRSEPKKTLEQLRLERLKREKLERERTEELMARLEGRPSKISKKEPDILPIQQKYNSQYNPEIAKQNWIKNTRNE